MLLKSSRLGGQGHGTRFRETGLRPRVVSLPSPSGAHKGPRADLALERSAAETKRVLGLIVTRKPPRPGGRPLPDNSRPRPQPAVRRRGQPSPPQSDPASPALPDSLSCRSHAQAPGAHEGDGAASEAGRTPRTPQLPSELPNYRPAPQYSPSESPGPTPVDSTGMTPTRQLYPASDPTAKAAAAAAATTSASLFL